MGRNRLIFYSVFATYQIVSFVSTLLIESGYINLFFLAGHLSWMKYITFIGVVLIGVDFLWTLRLNSKGKKEGASNLTNSVMKANIYDLQETRKEMRSAGSK